MLSAILEKGENGYTHMERVFNAIGNEQLNYNWLITNCECYPSDTNIDEFFSKEYIWISGEKLTEIISKDDFQFVWGVFSGFSPEVTFEEVLKCDLPFADGYKGFWVDNVTIQHPLADVEIVAWDSSLTLFISKYDKLVQRFRNKFPLSEDLSAQNTRHNSETAHIQELLMKELAIRNIDIKEESLHQKYSIWRKLYYKKGEQVEDSNIIQCIRDTLSQHNKNY